MHCGCVRAWLQAEVVEPFLRSLRDGQAPLSGEVSGMGMAMGATAADNEMFGAIAAQMGQLYDFFKKLNDQDRKQIK